MPALTTPLAATALTGLMIVLPSVIDRPPAGVEAPAPPGPPADDRGGRWRWPTAAPHRVLRPFSPPASPWGPGHRGVDLAVRPGTLVLATGAGRVAFAGTVAGTGVIVISHGPLRTSHLPVRASLRRGQRVTAGQVIGVVTHMPAHCGPVPCLHWGLRDGTGYRDPLGLPGLRSPVRLLPIWAGGRPPPGH